MNQQILVVALLVLAELSLVKPASAQDEYPSVELQGRIQLDYAFYDEDVASLSDGGEARRARIGVEGWLAPDWGYDFNVDFAGGEAEIKDALLEYTGLPQGSVLIGQFKQPFGLANLISSKYLTFIGQPLPVLALATDRRLGVGYQLATGHYTFALSGYGQNVEAEARDEGLGAGSRFTYAPLNEPGRVLHFGIAAAWEEAPDASETIRFRARPESHVTDVRLINTGSVSGVESLTRYGLEAAAVLGSFSLQGEWLGTSVQRDVLADVDVNGWYVFASYFLTGESRPYDGGVFARVKPLSDSGAWELALRYSSLNLDDGPVAGGEEQNVTLGLNYYLTPHIKFQTNYTQVQSERQGVQDDPSIVQFRAAYDF